MKPLWPIFLPSQLSLPFLTAEMVRVSYILICDSSSVHFANEFFSPHFPPLVSLKNIFNYVEMLS